MRVYVDTSITIRVLFREGRPLPSWGHWAEAYASRLWHTEALRVLYRVRMEARCDDAMLVQLRKAIEAVHEAFTIVPVTEPILARAGESFPTAISTLDAIHLSTALQVRDTFGLDAFLTHDVQLATAAAAMGLTIQGV